MMNLLYVTWIWQFRWNKSNQNGSTGNWTWVQRIGAQHTTSKLWPKAPAMRIEDTDDWNSCPAEDSSPTPGMRLAHHFHTNKWQTDRNIAMRLWRMTTQLSNAPSNKARGRIWTQDQAIGSPIKYHWADQPSCLHVQYLILVEDD